MKTFNKRVFTPASFVKRFSLLALYLPVIIGSYIKPKISAALREKVMLAVTSVNDCRYCSWAHTRLALSKGVDINEVNNVLKNGGTAADNNSDAAAILFAQHYADTNGKVSKESLVELKRFFNNAQVREIMGHIHTIYIGNLSGNTFDALLLRFSGKDVKIEGSQLWFELVCALLSAPILIFIAIKAKNDKTVKLEGL